MTVDDAASSEAVYKSALAPFICFPFFLVL